MSIAVKMRRRGNLEMTREVLEDSIVKMWQQMRKVLWERWGSQDSGIFYGIQRTVCLM